MKNSFSFLAKHISWKYIVLILILIYIILLTVPYLPHKTVMEAMKTLSEEIESLFNRTLASVRDDIHPTDDGQSERSCSGFPKSLKS